MTWPANPTDGKEGGGLIGGAHETVRGWLGKNTLPAGRSFRTAAVPGRDGIWHPYLCSRLLICSFYAGPIESVKSPVARRQPAGELADWFPFSLFPQVIAGAGSLILSGLPQ
jgi:hypothetical protein